MKILYNVKKGDLVKLNVIKKCERVICYCNSNIINSIDSNCYYEVTHAQLSAYYLIQYIDVFIPFFNRSYTFNSHHVTSIKNETK
jgi:hypothetical protein